MFKRAVIATDLGPSSEGVVACAQHLGILGVKEVILTYAIDPDRPGNPSDEAFARQAETLEDAGIRVHVDTPIGNTAHAIVALVTDRDADLVVMGTGGQGVYHTLFSGSVSSDVIRMSIVPVLLMPAAIAHAADRAGAACSRLLASVLVPVDLTAYSRRALDLACAMSDCQGSRIELLHVIPVSAEALSPEHERGMIEALENLGTHTHALGSTHAETRIERGDPAAVIGERAASGDYSLVVLAPGCYDTIEDASGSITTSVIRRTTVPVLVVPPLCDVVSHLRGNT